MPDINFDKLFLNSAKRLKANWAKAAHHGWYTNWHTPIHYAKKTSRQEIDKLMIRHIERDLEIIRESISLVCPERMEILDIAIDLHNKKLFIAAIPLLLAQAEGIFYDGFETNIFSKKKTKLKSILSEDLGENFNAFLHSSIEATLMREQTTSVPKDEICLIPNRHGILHGNKDFLNYGTLTNSYKSLALVAYTAFTVEAYKDNIKA